MHLHLYLGNVEHSELWLIEPILSALTNNYLQQEFKHLEYVFHIQNGYPLWIIKQIMKEVKENKRLLVTAQNDTPLQNANNEKHTPLCCCLLEPKVTLSLNQ